jgi:hypothetical protein
MRSLAALWLPWAFASSLLLAGAPVGADERERARREIGPATWYVQALTRGEAGLNVTHFWSKGPWMRAETVLGAHRIVTIVRGDRYYAYDALTRQGLAIRREPATVAADRADRRPFGQEYDIVMRQGGELVREEKLAGRRAAIFRVTDEVGRRELWATLDEPRVPLRVEIFDRRTGARRVTDYLNWLNDVPIADAFFEPDPQIALQEMDYTEYLRRTAEAGWSEPAPVLYSGLLYTKEER